jgi:hypothetical protein
MSKGSSIIMKIADAIRKHAIRLSYGERFLYGYDVSPFPSFIVCERVRYAREPKIVCETDNEDEAVAALLYDVDVENSDEGDF